MDINAKGNTTAIIASTVVATTVVLSLLKHALWPRHPKIMPSPLNTVLPRLSKDQLDRLEYKLDAFPGARDVDTPYGSIRVYEWGPETGRKVLFVHGISTSSMTLFKIAHALVEEQGCRVMLFDLFGRGFSDGVGDLPHDARLYTTQMLLALSSSDLAWTGSNAFSLIGYSLGGGVAVHFAVTFPHLVSCLILLAPAGLIRPENFGIVTRFVFTAGLIPERLLAAITKRKLQKPIAASSKRNGNGNGNGNGKTPHSDHTTNSITFSLTEAADPPVSSPEQITPLEVRVLRYVHWMLNYHGGFIPAFMSCIRDAPLVGQHEAWRRLALRGDQKGKGRTLVILAEDDEIIDPEHYKSDAIPLVGGSVEWATVPGGHDFPMTHERETLVEIYKAWGVL